MTTFNDNYDITYLLQFPLPSPVLLQHFAHQKYSIKILEEHCSERFQSIIYTHMLFSINFVSIEKNVNFGFKPIFPLLILIGISHIL